MAVIHHTQCKESVNCQIKKDKLIVIQREILSNTDKIIKAHIEDSKDNFGKLSKFLVINYDSETLGKNKVARIQYKKDKYRVC